MNRLAVATLSLTALVLCAWDGPIAPPLPPPPPFPPAPVPPAMADPAPTKAAVAPSRPTLSSAILDDVVTVVERAKAAKPSRDDDPALFAGLALKASEFPAIRDEIALAQHAIRRLEELKGRRKELESSLAAMTDSVRRSPAGVGPSNELEKVKDAEKALAPASEVEAHHRELVGQFGSRLPTFPSPADASASKDSAPKTYEPSIELTAALIDDFVTVEQRRVAAGRSMSPDQAMFEGLSLTKEQFYAMKQEIGRERGIREVDAAWAVARKPLEEIANQLIDAISGSRAPELVDHYRAVQAQIDHGDEAWRTRHATTPIGYANRRLIDKNLSRLEPAPRNPPAK